MPCMGTDKQMTTRQALDQALAVFGYSDAVPSHVRYGLLLAIMRFAGTNGRPEIEALCEAMMIAIRKENSHG